MKLDIDAINHKYGNLSALENINLSIDSAEIVALVGPSGCGKSTLLSIAGGLLVPTSGQAYLSGNRPNSCLNPLTYVFQDFALLPWRTVEGNIAIVLEDHAIGQSERRDRIEQVLGLTKLTEFRSAFPRQLSGGMRQRVGIARALAVSPALLLMDEPLSSLDAQTRTLLMDEFADLFTRTGISALYVTHNLNEAVRLAHRVVMFSRRPGRIKQILSIDRPVSGRRIADPYLASIEEQLWLSIREEALEADRECDDAA